MSSRPESEAENEFIEMRASLAPANGTKSSGVGSLWQRRYMVPFLLTCTVLGLTQTTGINSILQFLVVILQQAGLDPAAAAGKATASHITGCRYHWFMAGFLGVRRIGISGCGGCPRRAP